MNVSHDHELVSKNRYFWNIIMMGTKYSYLNIPMPHETNMENIFSHVWMKVIKWMKKLDEN
jgi:hypothetical protein